MNKTRKVVGLLAVALTLVWGCSGAQDPSVTKPERHQATRIRIVYLSRTNNTRAVAQIIQAQVGGKLVALEIEKPYPTDYREAVEQVARENAAGFRPPLKTKLDSLDPYDVVFIGFPTWGMQLPPPIKSFLAQYNLAGKTVVPFNTNAGYGTGSSFEDVKRLAPNSNVLEGFSTRGGVERDGILFVMESNKEQQVQNEVKSWLSRLKLPR